VSRFLYPSGSKLHKVYRHVVRRVEVVVADHTARSVIELLLLPRVVNREMVEPRKHPAEQAQAGLLHQQSG
jgi:hypothetical protein